MAIRDSDPNGRTIHGTAVPFGAPTRIWDWEDGEYDEIFVKGAFAKTIGERGDKVKLLSQHDRNSQLPLGRATSLVEESGGLAAEFYVSKTERGDEVLELVRDGALDSFSIGFIPISKDVRVDNGAKTVTRTEVSLREVSVVTFPAYESATIEGARCEADARQALADALRTGRPLSVPELAALRALGGTQGLVTARADESDPGALAAAVDAALDAAALLFAGVDSTALPPDVQQAIALVAAAGESADNLLDVMGVADPDETADDEGDDQGQADPDDEGAADDAPRSDPLALARLRVALLRAAV